MPFRGLLETVLVLILALLFVTRSRRAAAQIYRPPDPYAMWDTWLFKDGDVYHLFFLQSEPGLDWNTIGHAVSDDLVHWRPLAPISTKGPVGAWDEDPTLTGMTVRHDGGYIMFYGSASHGQKIGILRSTDLVHWERYPGNPILEIQPPHYGGSDWRDLCARYDPKEKRWHGYVCAQTAANSPVACVAHLTTGDLVHWEYHPPAFASAEFVDMEVPDYFELNGRHYLLFSSARSRKDTSGRTDASGTYYAMADRRDGPYRLPADPLLLGAGRGRFDNYVGRTIPFEGTRLLYHHTVGGPVTWATPKLVRQNDDGTLWLEYWPGLEQLETTVLLDGFTSVSLDRQTGRGAWRPHTDCITGRATKDQPTLLWLPVSPANAIITCAIDAGSSGYAGLVWRWDGAQGAGLTLDGKTHTAAIVNVALTGDTLTTALIDDFEGLDLAHGPRHVRILLCAHRTEVYMDNHWLFGTSLTDLSVSGSLGLLVMDGSAAFANLRVAAL